MHSKLSPNIVLSSNEKSFFADKTDQFFTDIGNGLMQVRQNLANEEFNADRYHGTMTKLGKCFPRYEDPVDDLPIRVGCRLLAGIISRYVTDKNARIIDIGAGTGYLGMEVKEHGFSNVDCMEPCQTFVVKQPAGIYLKLYDDVISHTKPSQVETDVYDCAILSSAVLSGHIEVEDIPELIRIVKPGGHVIFSIADYWLKYKDFGVRLDAMLQKQLENGMVDSVVKERIVYIYRVEDATTYILKKAL